jgi:hypothetical protein
LDCYTNDLESNIRTYIGQLYSFNFVNRKPNFFNLNNVNINIKDIIKVNKNIIRVEEIDDDQPEKCAQLAKVRGDDAISIDPKVLLTDDVINSQSTQLDSNQDEFCKVLEQTVIDSINDVCANGMLDLMLSENETNDLLTHIIEVRPNAEPIKQKTRAVPYAFKEKFRKTLMEMKMAGMIVDSKSPWSSPVRLVKKPDGSVRICVDYRKLNPVTIRDSYPIPRIEEIFSHLYNDKIFSTKLI